MAMSATDKIFVDFVGDDNDVVFLANFPDAHKFVFSPDAPYGIMGTAQQE